MLPCHCKAEPAALQSFGVSGCGARVIDVTTTGGVNPTLEVEAVRASGHVEDGDDITGCQFVSSVIALVEQYAATSGFELRQFHRSR